MNSIRRWNPRYRRNPPPTIEITLSENQPDIPQFPPPEDRGIGGFDATFTGDTGTNSITQSSVARIRIHAHGFFSENAQQMGISRSRAIARADIAVLLALSRLLTHPEVELGPLWPGVPIAIDEDEGRFLYEIPPTEEVFLYLTDLAHIVLVSLLSVLRGATATELSALRGNFMDYIRQLDQRSILALDKFCNALDEQVAYPLSVYTLQDDDGTIDDSDVPVSSRGFEYPSNLRSSLYPIKVQEQRPRLPAAAEVPGLVGRHMWIEAIRAIAQGQWSPSLRAAEGESPGLGAILAASEDTSVRPTTSGVCGERWMGYGPSEGIHFSCHLPAGHSGGHVGAVTQTQTSSEASVEDVLAGLGQPAGFASGMPPSEPAGTRCAYCHDAFRLEEDLRTCPACGSIRHEVCIAESGDACPTLGCPMSEAGRARFIDIDDRWERMTPEERAEFEAWSEEQRAIEEAEPVRVMQIDDDEEGPPDVIEGPEGWKHTDTIFWFLGPTVGGRSFTLELEGEPIQATAWGADKVYRVRVVDWNDDRYDALYSLDSEGFFKNMEGKKYPWSEPLWASMSNSDYEEMEMERAKGGSSQRWARHLGLWGDLDFIQIPSTALMSQYTLDSEGRLLKQGRPLPDSMIVRVLPAGSQLIEPDLGVERFSRLDLSESTTLPIEMELVELNEELRRRGLSGVDVKDVLKRRDQLRDQLEEMRGPEDDSDIQVERFRQLELEPTETAELESTETAKPTKLYGWKHTHDIHVENIEKTNLVFTTGRPPSWTEIIPVYIPDMSGGPVFTAEEWVNMRSPKAEMSLDAQKFSKKLAAIKGLGRRRMEGLLERFGSTVELAHASLEDLSTVRPRIPRDIQQAIQGIMPKPERSNTWFLVPSSEEPTGLLSHTRSLAYHENCDLQEGRSRISLARCGQAVLRDIDWDPGVERFKHLSLRRRRGRRRRRRRI